MGIALAGSRISDGPAPVTLMRVWAFETEGGSEDVLVSVGTLWGADLLFEALRVEDDDRSQPVALVRERFLQWMATASGPTVKATLRLRGYQSDYVLFAASA